VKNSAKHAKKFSSVLKRLKGDEPTGPPSDDPVSVMAFAFCAWESTSDVAAKQCVQLQEALIDWNDLRVSRPEEIADMAGFTDANRIERAKRLQSSMHAVYLREHETSMETLRDMKKRDARDYIETLDGMVPYVASYLMLHCYDIHSIPVDGQLCTLLREKQAVDESADLEEVSSWVSRQISADDGRQAAARLQAWVDAESARLLKETQAADRQAAQQRKRKLTKMEAERKKIIEEAAAEARKKAAAKAAAAKKAEAKKAAAAKKEADRLAAEAKAAEEQAAAKKAASKKKTSKKAAAKKKVTKKAATKKKTSKKAATKKKVTKKAATKKKTSKKAATKKKVTKKAATKKKVTKKAATKKKTSKKAVTKKKVTKKAATKKKTSKKAATRKKKGSGR
tara:strand:+ start:847 stop:2034 length:1188 start_codon:yes stop_codon:yes gene_type:complete